MAKKVLWSLERIKEGLGRFYKEYERYPTASEFDAYQYLPRTKTIERRFGGLVSLRKQLKLGNTADLRLGMHSSKRAHMINSRAHAMERVVYDFLTQRFGKEFVHREYFFTDDHRTRADFFVYDAEKGFCVDVFYPNSTHNLTGCLNIKLNKYKGSTELLPYPMVFLQMNKDLNQHTLDDLVKRKKRVLPHGQYLMCWMTFKSFCGARKPLSVLRHSQK